MMLLMLLRFRSPGVGWFCLPTRIFHRVFPVDKIPNVPRVAFRPIKTMARYPDITGMILFSLSFEEK